MIWSLTRLHTCVGRRPPLSTIQLMSALVGIYLAPDPQWGPNKCSTWWMPDSKEFLRWELKQQMKKRQSKRKKSEFFRTVNIFLFNGMQCRSAPLKASTRQRVRSRYNQDGSVRCDNSVMSHANFMLLSTKIICDILKIKTALFTVWPALSTPDSSFNLRLTWDAIEDDETNQSINQSIDRANTATYCWSVDRPRSFCAVIQDMGDKDEWNSQAQLARTSTTIRWKSEKSYFSEARQWIRPEKLSCIFPRRRLSKGWTDKDDCRLNPNFIGRVKRKRIKQSKYCNKREKCSETERSIVAEPAFISLPNVFALLLPRISTRFEL